MNENLTLLLASSSPRRGRLLEKMGLRFRVAPSPAEEWHEPDADPADLVRRNSLAKGEAVARLNFSAPVLAADTAVALEGKVFNKPSNLAEARAMLNRLSGKTHVVHTCVCLIFAQRKIRETVSARSRVTFKTLDETRIERYFEVVNPLDKAGAYGIQQGREMIIERWEGSFSNIMGLPVEATEQLLGAFALMEPLRL